MGLYARHIGPRLVNCLCSSADIRAEREKIVPLASGIVLEIGMGPGLNLPLYDPRRVAKVIGVDPNESFLSLGRERRALSAIPVETLVAPAERIPLPDASIDTAVITFTLCSVDDPAAALREVRRVLKADGRALVLEHGLSDDAAVARWQRRINPLWRRLAVGCNLDRPVARMIEEAGLSIARVEHRYLKGAPRPTGFLCEAEATI